MALGLCFSGMLNAAISHPTFVLVHGALLTSSSWMSVQSQLQKAGYNVVTVDVPGRADDGADVSRLTLDDAAAKVCKVASLQVHSVILVGHSQAGGIITQALDQCATKIKSLVYVAAVAPLSGETVFQDLKQQDENNFARCTFYNKDTNVYKVNFNGPLKEMFMADATEAQAERAIHNMVDEPGGFGDATAHYPVGVFKAKPKFYIATSQDRIISPQTQNQIINKIMPIKVYTIESSHSPFLSQPKLLADDLINIANQIK